MLAVFQPGELEVSLAVFQGEKKHPLFFSKTTFVLIIFISYYFRFVIDGGGLE